jgi:ATP-dependent DNA helicase RecG
MPVEALAGVGPRRATALREAGVATVVDLLLHLPQRYEDRRETSALEQIAELAGTADLAAPLVTVRAGLESLRIRRGRRRGMAIAEAVLSDGKTRLRATWFNRPYLDRQVRVGTWYRFSGRLRRRRDEDVELLNASIEADGTAGAVTPIYGAIGGLGPATVGRLIAAALVHVPAGEPSLPLELLERRGLPTLGEALRTLHRPGAETDLAALGERRHPAHLRLVYGELLALQLEVARTRLAARRQVKAHRYRIDDTVRASARAILPFRLTGAQRRVLREVIDDLRRPEPMLRLLQGDVGSGKTIVAALAIAVALENGLQAAFLAPTELLAEQHFATLVRWLGARYSVRLLSASAPHRERTLDGLRTGEVGCVVGTHALLEEGVELRRLALAVVDEQHRFGVRQRQGLGAKGDGVDLLVMTATPIPRSLALTLYGELDLSVIDELPPGRRPVATRLASGEERARVFAMVEGELRDGGRVFVVFPLIDDSERVAGAALGGLGRDYAERFAAWGVASLSGRTPAAARERTMARFAAGDVRVLLATTVVEVGVDIPGASLMVVESGERFGLAQLHQLRGRVGRGERASTCVVVHDGGSEATRSRLGAFAESQDGFALAEADLALRGPGEILGTRQAGVSPFRHAHPLRHLSWLEAAREDAERLLETNPTDHPGSSSAAGSPLRAG